MISDTNQIIQMIANQRELTREEVRSRIELLKESLFYDIDGRTDEDDPTIAKLLAQELNVDLGDPTNYLYTELLYDKPPICVRIIPFVTIDKEQIKQKLFNLGFQLEDEIRRDGLPSSLEDMEKCHPIGKIFMYEKLVGGRYFVKEGILLCINRYSDLDDETIINDTFEYIVDQAELYRTFHDYQIVRTTDPNKIYLPFSIMDKVYFHPPEWASTYHLEKKNRGESLQFPYVNLESLKITKHIEDLSFINTCTKEIIGIDALQYCPSLVEIHIKTELENLNFPPSLNLLNLKMLIIHYTRSPTPSTLDLTFLKNSPMLEAFFIPTTD